MEEMFSELNPAQRESVLEALLFVTDEPATAITLADAVSGDPGEVETALFALQKHLAERDSGIQLVAVAGGWRLVTHPMWHETIEQYILSWDTRRLSKAALETLAIIAYLQPVTRSSVAEVRGVNSDSSINSLVDKGLVREAGQAEAPGNPTLYATTKTFLEKFGLRTVKDLPPLENFAPDEETAALLRQGLSARTPYDEAAFAATRDTASEDARETVEELAAQVSVAEDLDDSVKDAMRSMIGEALAKNSGVVEKIDFDNLDFEE